MRSVESKRKESCGSNKSCTSVDAVVLVEVVHCIKDLADRLCGVLLSELALFADAIEKLSSGRQLCHDIVLVLHVVRTSCAHHTTTLVPTLDSNQS